MKCLSIKLNLKRILMQIDMFMFVSFFIFEQLIYKIIVAYYMLKNKLLGFKFSMYSKIRHRKSFNPTSDMRKAQTSTFQCQASFFGFICIVLISISLYLFYLQC